MGKCETHEELKSAPLGNAPFFAVCVMKCGICQCVATASDGTIYVIENERACLGFILISCRATLPRSPLCFVFFSLLEKI